MTSYSGKILLTGASGFVGYHTLLQALEQGYKIHAAVRKSSNIDHLRQLNIEFVYPDFNHVDALVELFKREQYDYIIHAAAATRASSQEAFNQANAEITRNIALAIRYAEIPIKKFIFLSSLALIGPQSYNAHTLIDENTTPRPITGYGKSKLLAEQYLQEFQELPILTIRPTAVYGPREKDLYVMFKTIAKGIEPYIGNKDQKLSFIYVADLVHAMLNGLTALTPNGLAINLSDGNVYNREDMARFIKQELAVKTFKLKVPKPLVSGVAHVMSTLYKGSRKTPLIYPERVGELTAENWGCSIERAKQYLSYTPQFSLPEGVHATIKWYKQEGWL